MNDVVQNDRSHSVASNHSRAMEEKVDDTRVSDELPDMARRSESNSSNSSHSSSKHRSSSETSGKSKRRRSKRDGASVVAGLVQQKLELFLNEELRRNRFDVQGKFTTTPKMHPHDFLYRVLEATELEKLANQRAKQKKTEESKPDSSTLLPKVARNSRCVVGSERTNRITQIANEVFDTMPVQELLSIHDLHITTPHKRNTEWAPDSGRIQNYTRHVGAALHAKRYLDYYVHEQGFHSGNSLKSARLAKVEAANRARAERIAREEALASQQEAEWSEQKMKEAKEQCIDLLQGPEAHADSCRSSTAQLSEMASPREVVTPGSQHRTDAEYEDDFAEDEFFAQDEEEAEEDAEGNEEEYESDFEAPVKQTEGSEYSNEFEEEFAVDNRSIDILEKPASIESPRVRSAASRRASRASSARSLVKTPAKAQESQIDLTDAGKSPRSSRTITPSSVEKHEESGAEIRSRDEIDKSPVDAPEPQRSHSRQEADRDSVDSMVQSHALQARLSALEISTLKLRQSLEQRKDEEMPSETSEEGPPTVAADQPSAQRPSSGRGSIPSIRPTSASQRLRSESRGSIRLGEVKRSESRASVETYTSIEHVARVPESTTLRMLGNEEKIEPEASVPLKSDPTDLREIQGSRASLQDPHQSAILQNSVRSSKGSLKEVAQTDEMKMTSPSGSARVSLKGEVKVPSILGSVQGSKASLRDEVKAPSISGSVQGSKASLRDEVKAPSISGSVQGSKASLRDDVKPPSVSGSVQGSKASLRDDVRAPSISGSVQGSKSSLRDNLKPPSLNGSVKDSKESLRKDIDVTPLGSKSSLNGLANDEETVKPPSISASLQGSKSSVRENETSEPIGIPDLLPHQDNESVRQGVDKRQEGESANLEITS